MGLVFTQMLFSFCLVSKISLPKLWTNNLSFHFFYLVVLIGYTACTHGPYTQGYATSAQGWFNACYGRQKIKGEIKLDYITLSPTPVVPHLSSINHGDVTHVRLLSNHAYSARELTVNQRDSERYPICTHTDSTINTRSTTLFSHTARLAFLRYTVAWSVMYVFSTILNPKRFTYENENYTVREEISFIA